MSTVPTRVWSGSGILSAGLKPSWPALIPALTGFLFLGKEAQIYAEDTGLLFMETSAKTAMNVNELFLAIGEFWFLTCPFRTWTQTLTSVLLQQRRCPKQTPRTQRWQRGTGGLTSRTRTLTPPELAAGATRPPQSRATLHHPPPHFFAHLVSVSQL